MPTCQFDVMHGRRSAQFMPTQSDSSQQWLFNYNFNVTTYKELRSTPTQSIDMNVNTLHTLWTQDSLVPRHFDIRLVVPK